MKKQMMAGIMAALIMLFLTVPVLAQGAEVLTLALTDGEYAIEVRLTGGSGNTIVASPAALLVDGGKAYARIQWNSPDIQNMVIGKEKFFTESQKGENSVFVIPVIDMDREIPVTITTSALGYSHEIDYALIFYSDTVGPQSRLPQEAAKRVVMTAGMIILVGGVLNHFVKKRREV